MFFKKARRECLFKRYLSSLTVLFQKKGLWSIKPHQFSSSESTMVFTPKNLAHCTLFGPGFISI